MAQRRMFNKSITQSDVFLDMPHSTQNLYFHLNMEADDDGFVNSPNKIMRTINANKNDMDLLLTKKFVIIFENGILVIKHWRIHNLIRGDRKKQTLYKDELSKLCLDGNNAYTKGLQPNDNQMSTDGMRRLGKVRLGKDSIGKDSIGEKTTKKDTEIIENHFENQKVNILFDEFLKMRKEMRKKVTQTALKRLVDKLNMYDDEIKIKSLEKSIESNYTGVFPESVKIEKNNVVDQDYLNNL